MVGEVSPDVRLSVWVVLPLTVTCLLDRTVWQPANWFIDWGQVRKRIAYWAPRQLVVEPLCVIVKLTVALAVVGAAVLRVAVRLPVQEAPIPQAVVCRLAALLSVSVLDAAKALGVAAMKTAATTPANFANFDLYMSYLSVGMTHFE